MVKFMEFFRKILLKEKLFRKSIYENGAEVSVQYEMSRK